MWAIDDIDIRNCTYGANYYFRLEVKVRNQGTLNSLSLAITFVYVYQAKARERMPITTLPNCRGLAATWPMNTEIDLKMLKQWVRSHLPSDEALRIAILCQPDEVSLSAFVELAVAWDRMMISR